MARRESFDVAGYGHGANPIPAVSRIGDLVVSGGISGRSLRSGQLAGTLEEQCVKMFELMKTIAETAGATVEDIIKVTIYLRKGLDRGAINDEWVKYFPNPESRPVRHVLIYDNLPAGMLVQCEFMAIAATR